MTTNRLARSEAPTKRTAQEWCEHGNAYCAQIGRNDVHWVIRNGKPNIEWRTQSASTQA